MSAEHAWLATGFVVAAYLLGSIPVGYLLAKARGLDIRAHGSGNIGATNVGRVLGKKLGVLVFALDALKGAIPTLAYASTMPEPDGASAHALRALVVAASIIGHVFPVWLRFRGGKGVATGLGALLATFPVLTLVAAGAAAVWLLCIRLRRTVGTSSVLAGLSMPLWSLLAIAAVGLARGSGRPEGDGGVAGSMQVLWPFAALCFALAGLVVYTHRSNIARALAGAQQAPARRAG